MKTKLHHLAIALLLLSTLNFQLSTGFAQGTTAFTYQGQLKDNGTNDNVSATLRPAPWAIPAALRKASLACGGSQR